MTKSVFTSAYRHFLDTLIQMRKSKKITQVQMAKELKKPQSYVSKYESGERRLDVIETLAILDVLKVSASKFMGILEKKILFNKNDKI